jgi:hypothetical protein
MKKSESIKEICKALICFKIKVESIKKDAKNPFFKSTYASLGNIIDAIEEPLAESGLAVCQFPTGEHGLTTLVMHESGEWIEADYNMNPTKNDPQGIGSCLTYQKRYALVSALLLNILEKDDDANYATFGNGTPEAPEDNKQWLNEKSPEFTGAVEKLKSGKSSIAALRNYFKISKQMETILTKAANL